MAFSDISNGRSGMELIPAYESDPVRFFKHQESQEQGIKYGLYDEPRWVNESSGLDEITNTTEQKNIKWRGRIFGGALLAATGAALLFEQSPANESVRASAAFNILEHTEDPLAAGGMVAGLTVVIEGATGALIATGLNRQKDRLQPRLERFRKNVLKDPESAGLDEVEYVAEPQQGNAVTTIRRAVSNKALKLATRLTDTGITCTIGPGMVVLRRHFQEEDRSIKKDLKSLAGYTAVGSGVSGGIGYLATGGVEHADKVGLETAAEYFVDYATDWKFWTGLLAVGYGIKYAKTGLGKVSELVHEDKA